MIATRKAALCLVVGVVAAGVFAVGCRDSADRVKVGMREAEARGIMGDPSEVDREEWDLRYYSVTLRKCPKGIGNLLVYRRFSGDDIVVGLDKSGTVACVCRTKIWDPVVLD